MLLALFRLVVGLTVIVFVIVFRRVVVCGCEAFSSEMCSCCLVCVIDELSKCVLFMMMCAGLCVCALIHSCPLDVVIWNACPCSLVYVTPCLSPLSIRLHFVRSCDASM